MVQEPMVDSNIEDGRKLIAQLLTTKIDVTAVFWMKSSDEDDWFLYIASKEVDEKGPAGAYEAAYDVLQIVPESEVSLSRLKMIGANDPLTKDVIAIRDRFPGRLITRHWGKRLGNIEVDEAFIYPKISGRMTRYEVMQTVTELLNRKGILNPSLITLNVGSAIHAVPIGLKLSAPGGIDIEMHDIISGTNRQLHADDVVNIQ